MLSVAAWPAAFAEVLQQGLENRALALEDLARRVDSVVQVRAVVLIALLAVVRKLIILDVKSTDALQVFALAAAILALGAVYWLVRDQDRRRAEAKAAKRG